MQSDNTTETFTLFGVELSICKKCETPMVGTDNVYLRCRQENDD